MPVHVWLAREDNRKGVRCTNCGLVANEPHQGWECVGKPEESLEDWGKSVQERTAAEARKAYYLSLLPNIREVARAAGYAIGVHGSLKRDFDLIAVPWTEDALDGEQLAHAVKAIVGGSIKPAFSMVPGDTENKNPGKKPHGRIAWTILLSEGADAKFIDLSVMPREKDKTAPHCDTCNDTGKAMVMVCHGGIPVEEMQPCPDCAQAKEAQG